MERASFKLFKEYSEAAIVKKEELYVMKSCLEELHTFLTMQAIFFLRNSEPRRQGFKEFQSS